MIPILVVVSIVCTKKVASIFDLEKSETSISDPVNKLNKVVFPTDGSPLNPIFILYCRNNPSAILDHSATQLLINYFHIHYAFNGCIFLIVSKYLFFSNRRVLCLHILHLPQTVHKLLIELFLCFYHISEVCQDHSSHRKNHAYIGDFLF